MCVPSVTFFRKCKTCQLLKPLRSDYFAFVVSNGKRRWRWHCRVCFAAARRIKRVKPKVKQREAEYSRKRWLNADETVRERNRRRANEWRKANPERHLASTVAAEKRRWTENCEEERLKRRVKSLKRRVRLGGSGKGCNVNLVWQMVDDQGGVCAYCDIPLFGHFEVDHMIPVSRGGSGDWSNLAVVCRTCNRSKSSKTVEEFFNQ